MKRKDTPNPDAAADEAARWFVRADAGDEPTIDAELSSWLAEQRANERALQRVELAVELARRLAADPSSALYAEAARAASASARPRRLAGALAWGGALAAALLMAIFIVRDAAPPAAQQPLAPMRAAQLVAVNAPSNPVAVLPNGVVVDASAVAVLPFAALGDATLAAGLEHEIVVALRRVPGLYVIANAAVSSYAETDLSPAEIGAQLGARGIVEAAVELVDGRVLVAVRLRETATGATLWQTRVDRPVDELRAVRDEIAESVAEALFDSSLRAQVARADGSSAAFAAKPFQQ